MGAEELVARNLEETKKVDLTAQGEAIWKKYLERVRSKDMEFLEGIIAGKIGRDEKLAEKIEIISRYLDIADPESRFYQLLGLNIQEYISEVPEVIFDIVKSIDFSGSLKKAARSLSDYIGMHNLYVPFAKALLAYIKTL